MIYWLIVAWFDGTHHCPWRRSKLVYAKDGLMQSQQNIRGLHTFDLRQSND